MLLGICGKPNTGKTTFFSAATLVDAAIAPYPFTTIEPNKGMTYVRSACPCGEFEVKCNPNNSKCEGGVRLIPTAVLDVAGLVPDAHAGKGLGNAFLDDLRNADALIQVVDASGTTDVEGKQCEFYDPCLEVKFLEDEIAYWIAGIIKRGWSKVKGSGIGGLADMLTGLKITREQVETTADELFLSKESINWSEIDILDFARKIRKISKPIIIAANKIDLPGAYENYERMKKEFPTKPIVPCCAEAELALRKAGEHNIIKYVPGDSSFELVSTMVSEKQAQALEFVKENVLAKYGSTGVQETINRTVFDILGLIVVFPVEDEKHLKNNFGAVLPDAFLMKRGSKAIDLAARIHSDFAEKFICALNVRTKMRVGRDYELKNCDIIKIMVNA